MLDAVGKIDIIRRFLFTFLSPIPDYLIIGSVIQSLARIVHVHRENILLSPLAATTIFATFPS